MSNRRDFSKALLGAGTLLATYPRLTLAAQQSLHGKRIPSSGESIPVIGLGTNRYGVGEDAQLRAPLKAALGRFNELGGTVVDTAPSYRSSEIVLGDLTRELGIVEELFMATKVDVEGKQDAIARMEQSFDRLHRDPLSLMQVHNLVGWRDALPVMKEWKDEGRIRYIGITTSREVQYDEMLQVMKEYELDFIQVNYSLANQRRSAERILPFAAERGMAVLANRPLGGGGVFGALSKATIPDWAAEFDMGSWAQFLLKYVVSHPAVTCAIPGMTKVRHVEDNLGAAKGPLPDAAHRRKMETFFDGL